MRTVCLGLIIAALSIFFLSSPEKIEAQETVLEDNFSGDLSQWQSVRDDGRFWTISNQALEAYIPFRSTITELVPSDEFWDFSIKNIEWTMQYLPIQGADKNLSFGYIDSQNWYELHFTNTYTDIVKIKNGKAEWVSQTGSVLPNGITYDLKFQFINGEINFFANGQQLFSIVDPTFAGDFGKIGLKASTGSVFPTRIIFDNIVVKSLDGLIDKSLHIPLLKQTDQAWADLEYDTASEWLSANATVSPGFKDWACNLISEVMLLRAQGITKLPDSTELNPVSFNQWLLDNNGYINSPHTGNINRLSVTKLSAEVSDLLNTPKLEYSYVSQDIIPRAIEEIDKGNPVILQLDGHFVLADGYTADKTDLLIKDPAFNVNKLSEHPRSLISMRLYSPSHTDLSYISIQSDPEVQISFADRSDAPITYNEYLTPEGFEGQSPVTKITEIAKPDDQNLQILVTASKTSYLEITTIQEDGTAQTLLNNDALPAGEHNYELSYKKNEDSALEEVVNEESSPEPSSEEIFTWAKFKQLVKQLYADREIKRVQFRNVLIKFVNTAERVKHERKQAKFRVVLRVLIKSAPKVFITKDGKELLLGALKLIES